MMLANILDIPYTQQQLSVVIVACILIGMFFGAMTVTVLRKKNKVQD